MKASVITLFVGLSGLTTVLAAPYEWARPALFRRQETMPANCKWFPELEGNVS
jgi:hypothetical protein